MATSTAPATDVAHDTFPINGTDYIEFWVGNAKQAAHFYRGAFGFRLTGYRGPETGTRDRASYLLEQNKLRFVLTSALGPDGEIAAHVHRHGDGVRDIAFWVDDAREAFRLAVERGAAAARQPDVMKDDQGEVVVAAIRTYGDTIHSLVERKGYRGTFMPGFERITSPYEPEDVGLQYVDHCVGNVELGKMNEWVEFYHGPGVQHIAIATNDIVSTVTTLRDRGVEFLRVPTSYYDTLLDRVGTIDEDLEPLRDLGILVDRDDEGYLLQIFSKPVQDRPTLFYEIIQRKGAKSFGKGNFKALFEAIEREQARRGNL